jgi:uncharacterized protein (DUF305 family)
MEKEIERTRSSRLTLLMQEDATRVGPVDLNRHVGGEQNRCATRLRLRDTLKVQTMMTGTTKSILELPGHRWGMRFAVPAVALFAVLSGSAQQSAPIVQPGAPGSASRRLPDSTAAVVPRPSRADVEFMQGMIMHHGQAVEMTALIPSHTDNSHVRALGARIGRSQADEMQFMKRWLAAHGEPESMAMPGMPEMDMGGAPMPLMPGMLSAAQMKALRRAHGAEFDRLFLTGMIQHHGGALVMVQQLFDTPGAGQDAELFDFATDADNSQRAEIRIMQDMLKEKR